MPDIGSLPKAKRINGPGILPKQADILIYGAGGRGIEFKQRVESERPDLKIHGFLDTHKAGKVDGLTVTRIADYKSETKVVIVVCSVYAADIIEELQQRKITPIYVYHNIPAKQIGILDITTHCNARCIFCGNMQNPLRTTGPDWDMKKFETAALHLTEVDEINFCCAGGEPLLNKNLPEMLSSAKKKGKATSFYTNGAALVSGRRLEKIVDKTDRIFISFISPRPDVQDRFMHGVKVKNIKANLLSLAASGCGQELSMNVLVMRKNILHLSEIVQFAGKAGVSQITFALMRREGQAALDGVLLDALGAEERQAWKAEIDKAQAIGKDLGIRIYISPNLSAVVENWDDIAARAPSPGYVSDSSKMLTRLCTLPWTNFTVYFSGLASPCCSTIHSLGNVFKDPMPLFEGPEHKRLKKSLLTGQLFGSCKKCELYPLGMVEQLKNMLDDIGAVIDENGSQSD